MPSRGRGRSYSRVRPNRPFFPVISSPGCRQAGCGNGQGQTRYEASVYSKCVWLSACQGGGCLFQRAKCVPGWRVSVPGWRVSVPEWRVSVPGWRVSVPGWRVSVPGWWVCLGYRVTFSVISIY